MPSDADIFASLLLLESLIKQKSKAGESLEIPESPKELLGGVYLLGPLANKNLVIASKRITESTVLAFVNDTIGIQAKKSQSQVVESNIGSPVIALPDIGESRPSEHAEAESEHAEEEKSNMDRRANRGSILPSWKTMADLLLLSFFVLFFLFFFNLPLLIAACLYFIASSGLNVYYGVWRLDFANKRQLT